MGSERKIEKGEKTDTSWVHSRGNDGDEQEEANCDEYNFKNLEYVQQYQIRFAQCVRIKLSKETH